MTNIRDVPKDDARHLVDRENEDSTLTATMADVECVSEDNVGCHFRRVGSSGHVNRQRWTSSVPEDSGREDGLCTRAARTSSVPVTTMANIEDATKDDSTREDEDRDQLRPQQQ